LHVYIPSTTSAVRRNEDENEESYPYMWVGFITEDSTHPDKGILYQQVYP